MMKNESDHDPRASRKSGESALPGSDDESESIADEMSVIEDEILFQRSILAALVPAMPSESWTNTKLLIGGIAILCAALLIGAPTTVRHLTLMAIVTVCHELGHVAGMWAFRFQQSRMFVVPFFARLTPAASTITANWKRGTTLLLGPLPGLLTGLLIWAGCHPEPNSWLAECAFAFVLINGFNLLPVAPLDGGRLFEVLFLAQRPWPGTLFRLMIFALMLTGIWSLPHSANQTALMGLAGLVLLGTPVAHVSAQVRRQLRGVYGTMPTILRDATTVQQRRIYNDVRAQRPQEDDPLRIGAAIRNLHQQATVPPATIRHSMVLMSAYLAGIAMTAIFFSTSLASTSSH